MSDTAHDHEHDPPPRRRAAWSQRVGIAEARHLATTPAGRMLVGAVAVIALLTVVGLASLWPYGWSPDPTFASHRTVAATIEQVLDRPCAPGAKEVCRTIVVKVEGRTVTLSPTTKRLGPQVGAGDRVRLLRPGTPSARSPGHAPVYYEFASVDRRGSLVWIAIAVALLAAAVLRWRGVLAVLGVVLSLALVLKFVVPALLAGRPPLLVAFIAALAVMFVTLVLTNGVGAQTLAAALGVSATLVITCVVAALAAQLAHLGDVTDVALLPVSTRDATLSLRGITLAAMLVGALGVLADTAVTQASAVMALRRVDASLGGRRLFHEAFVVGRDHLSATIHTLVLAYAGAALPLLLVLSSSNVSVVDTLNNQSIAGPIVATLVGCLALICAVPLATGLASLLVARLPREVLPEAHPHHH